MSEVEEAGYFFLTCMAVFALLMNIGLFVLVLGGLERLRHRNLFGAILVFVAYLAVLALLIFFGVQWGTWDSYAAILDSVGRILVGLLAFSLVVSLTLPKSEEDA